MSAENQNNNQALIDFAKANAGVEFHAMKDGNEVAVVPEGKKLESVKNFLNAYLKVPERLRGTSNHYTTDSFSEHFNKFKIAGSALFASENVQKPQITGVYNYNENSSLPNWGDHKAILHCQLAEAWNKWQAQANRSMQQREFAEFLEENIQDVSTADMENSDNAWLKQISMLLSYPFATQQQMLELSRGIEINEASKATQKIDISSGQKTLEYQNEHQDKDGKPLKIPGLFLIRIQVFTNGPFYLLPVRLRYRLVQGTVTWSFDIYRDDIAFKLAYDEICTIIAEKTGTPLYIGSAEA